MRWHGARLWRGLVARVSPEQPPMERCRAHSTRTDRARQVPHPQMRGEEWATRACSSNWTGPAKPRVTIIFLSHCRQSSVSSNIHYFTVPPHSAPRPQSDLSARSRRGIALRPRGTSLGIGVVVCRVSAADTPANVGVARLYTAPPYRSTGECMKLFRKDFRRLGMIRAGSIARRAFGVGSQGSGQGRCQHQASDHRSS